MSMPVPFPVLKCEAKGTHFLGDESGFSTWPGLAKNVLCMSFFLTDFSRSGSLILGRVKRD